MESTSHTKNTLQGSHPSPFTFTAPECVFLSILRENWFMGMGCIALMKNKKKSQYPYMLPPRGVSTAHQTQTNFVRVGDLPNVITHAKFEISWRRVEVSCFSTTTADAINSAKPCRAACDMHKLFT